MVSFSCEACNDTIKKPKLDQHAQRCRGAQFTCLDCNTTFQGTEYRTHTSCISEAQKYQKTLFKGDKKNKNNKPQQEQTQPAPAAPAPVVPAVTKPVEEPVKASTSTSTNGHVEESSKDKKKKKKDKKRKHDTVGDESKVVEAAPQESKTTNGTTTSMQVDEAEPSKTDVTEEERRAAKKAKKERKKEEKKHKKNNEQAEATDKAHALSSFLATSVPALLESKQTIGSLRQTLLQQAQSKGIEQTELAKLDSLLFDKMVVSKAGVEFKA